MKYRKTGFSRDSLAVLLALLMLITPLLAQNKANAGNRQWMWIPTGVQTLRGRIHFSPDQIPQVQTRLPVLRLSPQGAPVEFVNGFLLNVAPRARNLAPLARLPFFTKRKLKATDNLLGAFDGNRLAAYVDTKSGDAEVFPSLADLKPLGKDEVESAGQIAARQFELPTVIGKDDTRAAIDEPLVLNGDTVNHTAGIQGGSTSVGRAAYLAYVPLRRFVDRYRVCGLGSRALLVIGSGGSIQGFVRHWKTAKTVDYVTETRSRDEVARDILAQLEPAATTSDVEVRNVELAYYDGDKDFLQPVYRFTARISQSPLDGGNPGNSPKRVDDDFVIGYALVGKEFEPIPSLTQPTGPMPQPASNKGTHCRSNSHPSSHGSPAAHTHQTAASPSGVKNSTLSSGLPDPTVGRYVVRNDYSGWVNDANRFWDGISGNLGFITLNAGLFTDSQYFWAEPWQFTSLKDFFVNSVDVALIEAHGNWWLYTTDRNCCDAVNISTDIPSPGYGSSAGGSLDYLILHSCEVVPSPDDTPNWADPWWNVFGGLHSVVGYRTIMYIDDDVGFPYGLTLNSFAPVASSWLNTVSSSNAYGPLDLAATNNGTIRFMGRASTISACGHENDIVLDISLLPRAGCLRIFWFPG